MSNVEALKTKLGNALENIPRGGTFHQVFFFSSGCIFNIFFLYNLKIYTYNRALGDRPTITMQ